MYKKLLSGLLLLTSFTLVAVSCSSPVKEIKNQEVNKEIIEFVSKENDEKVNKFFKLFEDKIKQYEKISIFGHVNTDGDSHGSTFGLKELIKDNFQNKEVRVYTDVDSNIPDNLRFLEDEEDKNNRGKVDEDFIKQSLAISLDTATKDRVGNQNYLEAIEVLKMDHHVYGEYFDLDNTNIDSQLVYEASSAAEMLTRLASYNNWVISKKAAERLYTGITTDTGRFLYNNFSKSTLEMAAILKEKDIDVLNIFNNLYTQDKDSIKVESYIKSNIKYSEDGKLAHFVISKKDIEDNKVPFNVTKASLYVNYMQYIKGVQSWVLFTYDPSAGKDKEYRVEFRSGNPKLNVGEIAKSFGGGGHVMASGTRISENGFEEKQNEILKAIEAKIVLL